MKDYFLRAETREQIDQALVDAGLLTIVDGEPTQSQSAIIDYVGTIYRPTGDMLLDAEGSEYPAMEPIDGYHVNLLVTEPLTDEQLSALPIIPKPNNPYRVFAS